MHMLHNLFTWAMFAPFLSTGLAAPSANSTEPGIATKSIPACAASPTQFISLPFEFWLEVVALDPLRPLDSLGYVFEEGNPVALERDLDRFIAPDGRSYAKANIRRFYEITSLFNLNIGDLRDSTLTFAQIFSYSLPDVDYPGYNALGFAKFNPTTVDDYLHFRAVKVCTSSNETELRLRAVRVVDVSQSALEFGAAEEDSTISIFIKTQLNATIDLTPVSLRVRPFIPSSKQEQEIIENLTED